MARWESGRTAIWQTGRITISHDRDCHQSLPALPASVPPLTEPILLAPQVGFVVLLAVFVKSVLTGSRLGRVRLRLVVALSAALQLFEIALTRLVAVFALTVLLGTRLIVAVILH
jgi:hypothetical protein